MRLGEINELQGQIQGLADIMYGSTDGQIITAEVLARAGRHNLALQNLLLIRQGRLPLFTEGFSMAVARLRQYAQLGFAGDQIKESEAKRASDLLQHFDKWSPVVDLNAVTLTFTGSDLVNPTESQVPMEIESEAGWHKIVPP